MAGTYAHLALVNQVIDSGLQDFSQESVGALNTYRAYCELGAVSPDYPYLTFANSYSKLWADGMHYHNTVTVIREGIEQVKKMGPGDDKTKSISWLMGYASHVIADCIIHPVVNLIIKAREYAGHEKEHRIVEMHQDAYIFQEVMGETVQAAEHLDLGINSCTHDQDLKTLDPAISQTWGATLQKSHAGFYETAAPDFDLWHLNFVSILDTIPELVGFLPISRHVNLLASTSYPDLSDLNPKYIERVPTPNQPMDYVDVFKYASTVVEATWRSIDVALMGKPISYFDDMGEPNLDTGGVDEESLVFWGEEE